MKTIAIAMQKGGVGKSTLARSLAVAALDAGLNVLALDMDAQQSTVQWAERRAAELPLVRFVTEIDLPKILKQAGEAGCDLAIIDTPPARSTEAPAAVEYADLVLIPCTPDIEAYEQLPRTERLARMTGKPAADLRAAPKKKPPATGRAGLKHIGGYFDRETVEQVAILRARLDLDNSQLIKKAIEELYQRERAARKFGDR